LAPRREPQTPRASMDATWKSRMRLTRTNPAPHVVFRQRRRWRRRTTSSSSPRFSEVPATKASPVSCPSEPHRKEWASFWMILPLVPPGLGCWSTAYPIAASPKRATVNQSSRQNEASWRGLPMMELRAIGSDRVPTMQHMSALQDREGAKAAAARDELTPSNWKGSARLRSAKSHT
jgi:hypothetical protein